MASKAGYSKKAPTLEAVGEYFQWEARARNSLCLDNFWDSNDSAPVAAGDKDISAKAMLVGDKVVLDIDKSENAVAAWHFVKTIHEDKGAPNVIMYNAQIRILVKERQL